MRSNYIIETNNEGFTLIETIVGIVVLSISLSVITSFIYPISEQSADQLHQVKAAELAQSILNEIQNKAFDHNSDMAGGYIRCGEPNNIVNPCTANLGPETIASVIETRATFNDVDDYNELSYNAGEIKNSQGQVLELYLGYSMSVIVCNDEDYDGICGGNATTAKLITVTVNTPTDFSLQFSTYRANF